MKAVVFAGPGRVRVDDVAEPRVQEPGDAIVRVTHASVCASDLHVLSGKTAGMREGAVIGHEFVGTVTEASDPVRRVLEGRRVLGSFLIACGRCAPCRAERYNFCRNRRALGLGTLTGDLDGSQAEYVRVPGADLNLKALDGTLSSLDDEQALFAGDVMTTGFYASALASIAPGDAVAVIGAGPVGLFCALATQRSNPSLVVVLDADARRAAFASQRMGLDARDVSAVDAVEVVADATGGRLADVTIEAVGAVGAFKSAMKCTRDGGKVVVVGVYGAERYELSMGMSWIRGLDIRFAGMANIHAHWGDALGAVTGGELDPTAVITHRLPLESAEEAYELFASRRAMKVVLTP